MGDHLRRSGLEPRGPVVGVAAHRVPLVRGRAQERQQGAPDPRVDLRLSAREALSGPGGGQQLGGQVRVAELCSDGPLEECAEAAIGMANQRGGKDNITAVVAEVLA